LKLCTPPLRTFYVASRLTLPQVNRKEMKRRKRD
jgi:hypothetical protein